MNAKTCRVLASSFVSAGASSWRRVVSIGLWGVLILSTAGGAALANSDRPPKPDESPKKEKGDAKKAEGKDEEKEKKPEDRFLAVVGGDVYPGTGGVLRGATVLAKNGKIQALGFGISVPEKVEVIDASGLSVYPGLVAVRSSGIAGGGKNPEDSFNPYSFNVVLALAYGITTVVSGNDAVKLTYGTLEDHVLKKGLFVNLPDRRNLDRVRTLRKGLEKVRQYIRDLGEYELRKARGDKEAKEPDKKWLKGNYLSYYRLLTGSAKAKVRATVTSEIRLALEMAQEFGYRLVIERGTEGWTMASDLGRSGVELILTVRRERQPPADPRTVRQSGWNIESSRILYDHGVSFAIIPWSSGISTLFGMPGRDLLALPMEAAFAVRGGLSEEAAIDAITLGAARVLGIDSRVGSLAIGKDADLIVTDGDLLHYNTWVQYSVVNGRLVYDKEKEPVVQHIRSRDPESAEDLLQFWPRRATDAPGRLPHGDREGSAQDPD